MMTAAQHPSPAVAVVWWVILVMAVVLTGACIAWSAWLVGVYYRDGRREREGRCLRCGYDLSHTAAVCPECGEPIRGHRKRPGVLPAFPSPETPEEG